MYRLRQVWDDYRGRLRVAWKSLALEIKNSKPTPMHILDHEIPLMAEQDPTLPIGPWKARPYEYPPTMLPAFEAIKCAALQGDDPAWVFSWNVRLAFFRDSRCICMRHVLRELAGESGLDVERFQRDWDSGAQRPRVLAESHHGWEEIKVLCSPTFVLADGRQYPNPGAYQVTWSQGKPAEIRPPEREWREAFREMLNAALALG